MTCCGDIFLGCFRVCCVLFCSALYVVDLKKFRRIAAGDRLRGQYQGLSQDPNSLSNLDQVGCHNATSWTMICLCFTALVSIYAQFFVNVLWKMQKMHLVWAHCWLLVVTRLLENEAS